MGAAIIVFDVVFAEPDRTSPARAVESLRQAGATVTLPDTTTQLDNDNQLAEAFARHYVVSGLILSAEGRSTPPRPKAGHGISGTLPDGLMVDGQMAIRNLPVLDEAATGIGEFSFKPTVDGVVRKSIEMRAVALVF